MKKIILLSLTILCLVLSGCTGDQKRGIKSFKSNIGGGLDRTIILYDYNGKEIRRWTGNIDLSNSELETDFILEGKRVIIQGGIRVIEEK